MRKTQESGGHSLPDWEMYLAGNLELETIDQCRTACHSTFKDQRKILTKLYSTLLPKRIGCLGSGCLNDIPVEEFLQKGSEVFLIDWIPNLSREGFKSHIIHSENGRFSCFLCNLPCIPEKFCNSWSPKTRAGHDVCENFILVEGGIPRCENYHPGLEPHFVTADVTSGRATSFAQRVGKLISSSSSPAQAVRKAGDEARRCSTITKPIPIPEDSLDFVTSSMVMSQFEHEPLTFLITLLKSKFGDRLFTQKDRVSSLLESLRTEFFKIQAEGHVREMHRLVNKKKGKVYFSVELFRSTGESLDFFMVHEIPQAMAILGDYFFFDFQNIPPENALRPVRIGNGTSIIQSYLLTPKKPSEPVPA